VRGFVTTCATLDQRGRGNKASVAGEGHRGPDVPLVNKKRRGGGGGGGESLPMGALNDEMGWSSSQAEFVA